MKMRLEFLLLVVAAFPSCLSRMGHDSGEDSRQDSHRDSRRSRGRSRDRSPRLLPAPLVLLLPSEPGPPRLRCLAPRRFPGSTFELLPGMPAGMPGLPVRSVLAAPDQHWAEFSLPGTARCWRCRYRNHNGSAWLESELSPVIGSSDLGDVECHLGDPGVTGPPPTAGTLRNGTGPAPAAGLSLSGGLRRDPGAGSGDLPSLPSRSFLAPPGLSRCRRPGAAAGGCGRGLARPPEAA
ncbi:uncharacterized protein [Sylvia atricapilla]|uniref:uncharacterized protein isoform X1 n=1 Tax=Sylvia atricapilla TaxID=48155 RepID=UPI00339197AA